MPPKVYLSALRDVALLKSVWYSARLRLLVLVGRRTRVAVPRSARVVATRRSVLLLGLQPLGSEGATVELRPNSTLVVDGLVQVLRGASLRLNWGARLEIGGGTYLNAGARIECERLITVGSGCAIGYGARIFDGDGHRLTRADGSHNGAEAVAIGRECWIGSGSTVLSGASVGDGSVVAAHSLVTHQFERGRLVMGTPARDHGPVSWSS